MKNFFKSGVILFTGLLLAFSLYAADSTPPSPVAPIENPVTMIQGTINALQDQINAGGAKLATPQALYAVIKQTVMPDVDIDRMAGLAVGRAQWSSATPAQKQQFIDQFGLLLTRTYGNALLTVSNYTIEVYPLRSNSWQTQQYVAVNGKITSKTTSKSSNLTYYLERSGNSWKIYDLQIEGVSFLSNYKAQFQSFSSMDTLTTKITQMNQQSAS